MNTNVQTEDAPRLFVAGTLSKKFGGFSGKVPGLWDFIAHIYEVSPYFHTPNPFCPGVIAVCARAPDLVIENPVMIAQLHDNTRFVRNGLIKLGIKVTDGLVPMICVVLKT